MKPDQTMNDPSLDEHLRSLAIAAQSQPKHTAARKRVLAQLIRTLIQSQRLVRPYSGQFTGFYEEIYAEAIQRLCIFICEKIETYDPSRGEVLQWANFRLQRQFFVEASREFFPTVYKGLDPRSITRLSVEDLDRQSSHEVNPQLIPLPSEEVRAYLQEDPENSLKQTHIENHPAANFQRIALLRLDGYSWQDLSTEFGIAVPTLSSFYQRCLKRFAPKIRNDLSQ